MSLNPAFDASALPNRLRRVIDALEQLEQSIRTREGERIAFREYVPGTTVEDIVDQHGRPVLADVLCAQANALAALAGLERS